MSKITAQYYDEEDNKLPGSTTNVENYTVKVDVEGNDYYLSVENVESPDWNFAIKFKGEYLYNFYVGTHIITISYNPQGQKYQDGTTSTEIIGNRIFWLKQSSYGTSAWYWVDNHEGILQDGSIFWVRWLNKEIDPEEYVNLQEMLDEEHKNAVEDNNGWIFETGVYDPAGQTYKNL